MTTWLLTAEKARKAFGDRYGEQPSDQFSPPSCHGYRDGFGDGYVGRPKKLELASAEYFEGWDDGASAAREAGETT